MRQQEVGLRPELLRRVLVGGVSSNYASQGIQRLEHSAVRRSWTLGVSRGIRPWKIIINFRFRLNQSKPHSIFIARAFSTTNWQNFIRKSKKSFRFVCAENFQGLPPEAIPAFLQNLQNSASYNIAKPIARPAAYHPYHRPSHQPPQRHLPPNAHHTLQQLFYRGPYLTGKYQFSPTKWSLSSSSFIPIFIYNPPSN